MVLEYLAWAIVDSGRAVVFPLSLLSVGLLLVFWEKRRWTQSNPIETNR